VTITKMAQGNTLSHLQEGEVMCRTDRAARSTIYRPVLPP
jgi:hypothetical protein